MPSPLRAPGLRTIGRLAALAGLVATLTLNLAAASLAAAPEAPFGDKVSEAITNYNRATPFVGTSGRYGAAAVAEVKALGFATIVELRGPDEEGVAANEAAAKAAGLRYVFIPVTEKTPTEAQIKTFAQTVEDPANLPVLVNCHSANRVGAMWALYRAKSGVPAEIAVEEGRTAGLKSREPAVRALLGLAPLSQ